MEGVDSWITKWADFLPEEMAFTIDGKSVTWAELDARVNTVARHLLDVGIEPGDRVGAFMLNRIEYLEILFAVSRVGAIFVPLNTRYAPRELAYALDHVGVRYLATEEALAETVTAAGYDVPTLWLSQWPVADDGAPVERVDSLARWDADGFLLFTSGSTGAPRAVLHSHASFLFGSLDSMAIHGYSCRDRIVTALPLCYTGGMNVIAAIAHSGASLVLFSEFDAGAMLSAIDEYQATVVQGVPTMLDRMVDHPEWDSTSMASLRLVRTGGAPVPVALIEAWAQRGAPVSQAYGLTESFGSGFILHARESTAYGATGRPSFTLEARLVGVENDEEVPVGEVGEICLRGPQIMKGYWNEPEATERAIVDGWLRTGDLGRRDERGLFQIVGRIKELIVTGGLNVYPVEVEHVIREAPGVLEAAVIGRPSDRWGEEVVAIVVTKDGARVTEEDITAHVRALLADYKCPKSVVITAEPLPRTTSGKVAKTRLADLVGAVHG